MGDGYGLGFGEAILDLTTLPTSELAPSGSAATSVSASVGVGHLIVYVPTGTTVRVNEEVGAGSLTVVEGSDVVVQSDNVGESRVDAGRDDQGNLGGVSVKRTLLFGTGTPQLTIDAKVGVGQIEIREG